MKNSKIQVIANWKMNPESLKDALQLFNTTVKSAKTLRKVETTICPPFIFIGDLRYEYSGSAINLGAQDLFIEEKGSHTGEISPTQLLNYNVSHAIVGHSERRARGETNEEVNEKVKTALKHKLIPIICIGERERDGHGHYLQFIHDQLRKGLTGVSQQQLQNVIIAYEPIWAIGKTGEEAITPQKLHEMILYIRKVLVDLYSKKLAMETTIIYGGSAEPDNVHDLLTEGQAQGFLVGHASLSAKNFVSMLKTANAL